MMREKEYQDALYTVYVNLIGDGYDYRPISYEFALKLANYIDEVLKGKSPQEIAKEHQQMSER